MDWNSKHRGKVFGPLKMVWRKEWRAEPSTTAMRRKTPFEYVFTTNTLTDPCPDQTSCSVVVRAIQREHIHSLNSHFDIHHNFLIGGDGAVYEGRGWDVQPMLPRRFKYAYAKGILIAFIGPYTDRASVPPNMLQVWEGLIQCGIKYGRIKPDYILEDIFSA